MSKQVVFSFLKGDLNSGFPVVISQLSEDGDAPTMKFSGSLPPAPEIPELYKRWRLLYDALQYRSGWSLRLEIDDEEPDVSNVSEADFSELCQRLENHLNTWLNSDSFRNIDQQIRAKLNPDEEIRVIIETDNLLLRKLPWHLWNLFKQYPQAEIALSAYEYERPKTVPKSSNGKVKILAILGNSREIDIQQDKSLLEKSFPRAKVKFLVEPQPQQLNDQLWEQGWDILFFAGHSLSQKDGETGQIYINKTDKLTISQLKNALQRAISRGLKLAIFNSCDGLGLAKELAGLNIPQTIVMREPVPDKVAHEFLKYLLKALALGKPLYLAVREARERLQGIEKEFPCATWLPTICQNPLEAPPMWGQSVHPWRRLQAVFCASVLVTGLVMGVRSLGMLEALELPAYDVMMRMRPQEEPDDRLVLITITGEDLQLPEQQERRAGLSDQALDLLLKKLEPHKPRVVGLDILRDFNVNPKYKDLASRMRQDAFIGICHISEGKPHNPGTPKPPEVPIEQVGFSDVLTDKPYNIIRRHLLHTELRPTTRCGAPEVTSLDAFSLKIALRYLEKEGIKPTFTSPPEQYLQLGNIVFKELETRSSGYQTSLNASGHQILLYYRSVNGSPLNITDYKFTLKQVLKNEVDLNFIKDKIVLIGVDAPTIKDYFLTPYTQGQEEVMPGVIIHAQMVSQIISAALGERSLLMVWSVWSEVLWVWTWCVVGGLLAWCWRSPIKLGLAVAIALSASYALCYVFLVQAFWIPFIPSVIALLSTGSSIYYVSRNQQSSRT
ncbi:CHASE2 domain-containing protein [Scytonema sp. PRP1]|uniref:CHASE2 domain-containing protein n=1 Tax=Scytonema sp. PRP1 TaxID=3120513 RepID=UPI00300C07C6